MIRLFQPSPALRPGTLHVFLSKRLRSLGPTGGYQLPTVCWQRPRSVHFIVTAQHTTKEGQGWWNGWYALGAVLVATSVLVGTSSQVRSTKKKADLAGSEGFRQKYRVGKKLGEGTYGTVHVAVNKETGERVAAKIIRKVANDPRGCEAIDNEVKIMQLAGQHPNIVSLKEIYDSPSEFVLVMDLVSGGELFDRIIKEGKLSEKQASSMMRQVCEALRHLHARGICHNDLKPENLLLTSEDADATVKLADFGTSLLLSEPVMMDKPNGTAAYRAPEIILHQPCERSVDMWGLGVVMYILVCGVHPFDVKGNSSNAQIMLAASECKLDVCKGWARLSDAAKDLLTHLLDPNPETRYTAEQALAHPWLGGSAAPDNPLPVGFYQNLRGQNNLRQLRVAVMAVGASLKTNVAAARKFYLDSPATVPLKDRKNELAMEAQVYKQAFNLFDQDHDGVVSSSELNKVFKAMGQNLTEQELRLLVAEADLNGDGVISLDEFIGLMQRRMRHAREAATGEEMKAIFQVIDKDGDGHICAAELKHIMVSLGEKISDEQIDQMIKEADTDGNGKIDYNEFIAYLTKDLGTFQSLPRPSAPKQSAESVGR
eukprot:comp19792_c0_seq1/m.23754 comp19792_c0_seq1/g.23754  ORF comp19792_c0_seq1/g.23754 comp19792_c0_seq1/m.23754 type:complete len:599 (-) comp19792_c0_seq1:63-1859(-)